MRAGAWSTFRDIAAARVSWERARQIADALPDDDPDRTAMHIAPRTMLCGSAWRGVEASIAEHFDELRELCTLAGDKASLAIGMTGLMSELELHARVREASRLASEQMALLESIGDPTLTVGLAVAAIGIKLETGEMADVLGWSQTVIELADGDPARGNFVLGSPLAASRGTARWALGHPGWRDDLDRAVAMARERDPVSHFIVIAYKYHGAILNGVFLADDAALRDIDEPLRPPDVIGAPP